MEVLSPAGNLEKLKTAFLFGADAVYLGLGRFSLRTAADNFTFDQLREGVEYAHNLKKRVYITANIIPHNDDLAEFDNLCSRAAEAGADALIISDLGAMDIALKYKDKIDIHISTQASNTNYRSINVWHRLGAKRIILARELSFAEIAVIRKNIPPEVSLEMFVHGAMCIAYSGRCLLSNYMASRDANRGECAQPCRWKYYLNEEQRPGEFMRIAESDNGTFIFNSKDLCLAPYIKEIHECGINSIKIEGRMKSPYYAAIVTKAYRQIVDDFYAQGGDYSFDPYYYEELCKVSHRDYTTGFAFGKPDETAQVYTSSSYIRNYDYAGIVRSVDFDNKTALIEQRNKFCIGDTVEIVPPAGRFLEQKVTMLRDENGQDIETVRHAQMMFTMNMDYDVDVGSIIRIKR